MEKFEKFKKIIAMSINLLSMALEELLIINEQKDDSRDADLMKRGPFKFYKIPLQYMIVMELTKLLEGDTKDNPKNKTNWEKHENTNAASIAKFLRITLDFKGPGFEQEYLKCKSIIEEIKELEFYENIKDARNQKFGHSDADYPTDPFEIRTYSGEEIKLAKSILLKVIEIYNRCIEKHFIERKHSITRNFIDLHIVYEAYYSKHIYEAMEEGFNPLWKREGKMSRKF